MWARATITVKYLPPTDTKPARLVAKCQAGRRVYSYPGNEPEDNAYYVVAKQLMQDLQIYWGSTFTMGRLDDHTIVFTPLTSVNVVNVTDEAMG